MEPVPTAVGAGKSIRVRIVNASSAPALLLAGTSAPNAMNLYGNQDFIFNTNYIEGQEDSTGQVGGYATNDVQVAWDAPWNATIAVGATNVGDRYPELVGYDGRPWNFYLYDAHGRTTYFRYTQRF